MNVSLQSQPAPGSTQPGDLYVDLQSRQLWLGVDTAVDANGSVLISDLVALQTADTTNLNTAKAYTDSSLTLYAKLNAPAFTGNPTAPTQASTDNSTRLATTAFVKTALAADTGPFVAGMIMAWSGLLTSIGVGALAGWALCDGTNGTPNLRDRFIIGAGNLAQKAVNPLASATTNTQAAHSHGGASGNYAITAAQLPYHQHNVTVHGVGDFNSGGESVNHTHSAPAGNLVGWSTGQTAIGTTSGGGQPLQIISGTGIESAAHYHATHVDLWSSGTSDGTGGSGAHNHTISSDGAHAHTITSAQIRDSTPYMALAYIMKL